MNKKQSFMGVLVSRYIGVKLFLHSISQTFGFPPTKVSLYKAWVDENNMLRIEEI